MIEQFLCILGEERFNSLHLANEVTLKIPLDLSEEFNVGGFSTSDPIYAPIQPTPLAFENGANVRVVAPEFLVEGLDEGFQITLQFADVGQLSTTITYGLAPDSEAGSADASIGSGSASLSVSRLPSGTYDYILPIQPFARPGETPEERNFSVIDDELSEGTEILRIALTTTGRTFENGSSTFVIEIPIYDDEPFTLADGGDTYEGTPIDDTVFGGDGNDVVTGQGGNDSLFGDAGNDSLDGGSGNDTVLGGRGEDSVSGGSGNDVLQSDAITSLSGIEGEVFRAYQAALGRAPDAGGFQAVVNELRLGNQTQLDVIEAFVGSSEFIDNYGELSDRAFIEQLYRNVLGREGDSEGIEAFTSEVEMGNLTRAEVVQAFANSPEYIATSAVNSAAFATNVTVDPIEAQVFRLYQAVFNRLPDEGGFESFVFEIGSGRLSLLEATEFFVTSDEFVATYDALSNAEFVELLYTNVLPGNTDAQGRAAFTVALDSGELSRAGVVANFVDSFEFVTAQQGAAVAFSRSVQTDRDDVLDGGAGDDVMLGGQGADTFVISEGADTILDFQSGIDNLDASALGADFDTLDELLAVATQQGLDTVFDFGSGNKLTLENVQLGDLGQGDFIVGGSAAAAEALDDISKSDLDPIAELPVPHVEAELVVDIGHYRALGLDALDAGNFWDMV